MQYTKLWTQTVRLHCVNYAKRRSHVIIQLIRNCKIVKYVNCKMIVQICEKGEYQVSL